MTLSTYIVVRATEDVEQTAEKIYQLCRGLLGTPESVEPEREVGVGGVNRIDHRPGIGLPAWLLTSYRPGGPSRVPDGEDWDKYEREARDEDPFDNGWGSIQINFDTAYSYRGPNGEGCSQLHALYITALARSFEELGLDWKWRDEYQGEWYDKLDHVDEFGGFHDKPGGPADWFENLVVPAILANGGVIA